MVAGHGHGRVVEPLPHARQLRAQLPEAAERHPAARRGARITIDATPARWRDVANRADGHEDSQKKKHRHVYDLGLLPREVRTLRKQAGVVYHAFNFSNEPAHFAMRRNAGAYAWKPVLIKEMLDYHASDGA